MRSKESITSIAFVAVLVLTCSLALAQTPRTNGNEDATASASPAPAALSASATSVVAATGYVIGPDDVLVVNVWKEPDLSRSVVVRPDGKITLPLLKDMDASGSTPEQLQSRIEKGLADYVSKPSVTVIVQEAKSHKFNILGAVQKPGTYILSGPMTVLDAIALAGGLREWAKAKSIYILRMAPDGSRKRIPFDYKKVVKGAEQDAALEIRDTIVVP
jgi:polysaccharide export outer membrane protein